MKVRINPRVLLVVLAIVLVLPLVTSPSPPVIEEYKYTINSSVGSVEYYSYTAVCYELRIEDAGIKIFSRGSGNAFDGAFLNVEIRDEGHTTSIFSDWNCSEEVILFRDGTPTGIRSGTAVLNIKDRARLILDIKRFEDAYPGLELGIRGVADDLPLPSSKLVITSAILVVDGFQMLFAPKIVEEEVHYRFEPVIITLDERGVERDEFTEGENVYVKATGLLPNTRYKIWVQPSPVAEGCPLTPSEDPSGVQELVASDELGNVSPVLIWENATATAADDITRFCVVFDEVGAGEGTFSFENDGVGVFSVLKSYRGRKGHIRRHHHPSPSRPPAPIVRSCDAAGRDKDVFAVSESIYCYAKYLPANVIVRVYVVDKAGDWREGAPLEDVSDGVEVVRTDGEGCMFTKIWNATLIPGEYSIVVDVDGDGRWSIGEPVDDDVYVLDFSIPEFPTMPPLLLILFLTILLIGGRGRR
ncbi:MAG: hypothetical protein ACXQTZ_04560 [Candidatus Alkanophagales archaeon]